MVTKLDATSGIIGEKDTKCRIQTRSPSFSADAMLQTQCYNGARGAVTKKKPPALDRVGSLGYTMNRRADRLKRFALKITIGTVTVRPYPDGYFFLKI